MAEAGELKPKRTTLRGWLVLAMTFGLLAVGMWGKATHNGLYEAIGFLPLLLALLVFMIRSDRRAKRDPEYAAHIAAIRVQSRQASRRKLQNKLIWVGMSLGLVFLLNVLQHLMQK